MTSSHVAHDAVISNDCVIGHSSLIGGHVIIEKGATIAVLSGIHQFCRVGAYAMVGPGTMITKDVVPFTMVKGDPPRLRGLNKERLRRLDFSEKQKKGLKKAYNILFRSSLLKSEALIELQKLSHDINEIEILLDFFNCAKRGTYR
jgi:UDP-N-acetylglucosamine acyltransferase